MRTIQRNAANAYYPVTINALTVPPAASSAVESYWDQIEAFLDDVSDSFAFRNTVRRIMVREALSEADLDEIMYEIEQRRKGARELSLTRHKLLQGEYHTFVGEDCDIDKTLKTCRVSVPAQYEGLIERVTLVKRLREVLVLEGFRRITPEPSEGQREMMSLSKEKQNWLPGVELLGEGVFIRLSQTSVNAWLKRVGGRYDRMAARLENSTVKCDVFSPQYVLLHTFAHALIRQLAMECGYSASSLKERVYSTYPDDKYEMCGVLIYTSSADSDGSLGGLVRCGKPENFGRIIGDALRNIAWCSADPLCYETEAQGYKSLNYAACHACALLPETSCEMRNCLLDRVSLIGKPGEPELGFFSGDEFDLSKDKNGTNDALDEWALLSGQIFDSKGIRFLEEVKDLGLAAPSVVGFELETGELAELAWESQGVVYLMGEQVADRSIFERAGWSILSDASSAVDIVAALKG